MNDGIGVPSTPFAMRVAMSVREAPPRNVHRFARFAGAIGWLVALMMAAGAGWKPH
jgi:hypothetical protein